MAAERQEALREFVAVTGTEEDRARFFLESAGWDLQIALASFYEDGGDEDIVTISQATPSSVSRGTAPSDNRVTSFRDLIHDQDEEEEEEEGQRSRFYAGGSERSGQQIVGPPRKKSPNELVDDLFKGAKEHGAVAVERVTKSPGETSKPRVSIEDHCLWPQDSGSRPFAGGGYRLGAAPEEESAYVAGERRRHSGQDVHVVLKLWKSGFSLDNGELRSYQDPSNAQFLESIRRGEVPAELRRLAHGGQVNLDMEDHRDEDFVKPKGAFKAFTGEGQKLGSTAPQVLNTSSPAQQAENEAKASSSISIDESQPTTNIQIRLADGGRLVQKFNHSHRISDIRLFIVDARPAMAATSFVLMTTFPNKELADENQTLKEANLLNAVIVQRLT
ncbi:NSFL1 cofactor p47 isoform X2 [Pteropus alecto]|uniref:NSFL1 cofactor p47 n=1 Tax=Pteropus vampyrus TaxID=132908 RepID=A0A6P6C1Z4_PTEVA|nr:NSFL1 cofactor p47 isoform X2 [Pteropus vampyrus]XP_024895649.1 NSFL1 cofactor p47 isoform X2 [Pteropus alecto]XP_039719857.1 NSFL1 cofactor p47 isoform X2 [Pteropus giganteus]